MHDTATRLEFSGTIYGNNVLISVPSKPDLSKPIIEFIQRVGIREYVNTAHLGVGKIQGYCLCNQDWSIKEVTITRVLQLQLNPLFGLEDNIERYSFQEIYKASTHD